MNRLAENADRGMGGLGGSFLGAQGGPATESREECGYKSGGPKNFHALDPLPEAAAGDPAAHRNAA